LNCPTLVSLVRICAAGRGRDAEEEQEEEEEEEDDVFVFVLTRESRNSERSKNTGAGNTVGTAGKGVADANIFINAMYSLSRRRDLFLPVDIEEDIVEDILPVVPVESIESIESVEYAEEEEEEEEEEDDV
jgi:hypothetical protein